MRQLWDLSYLTTNIYIYGGRIKKESKCSSITNSISGSFSKSSWVSRVTFQDFGQVVELRDRFFNDQQRGKSNFSGISSNDLLIFYVWETIPFIHELHTSSEVSKIQEVIIKD